MPEETPSPQIINQKMQGAPSENQEIAAASTKSGKKILILYSILIAVVLVAALLIFIKFTSTKTPSSSVNTQRYQVAEKHEKATRIYYSNGKQSQVLTEENIKSKDGTLETIVSKDGKVISHHLYLKDKILSLVNGVLTQQIFKTIPRSVVYRTTGENFLSLIKNNPDLKRTPSSLNGIKVEVYTLGESKKTGFNFIKKAFAQSANISGITNIYVGEDGQLLKVEVVDTAINQPTETIVYDSGPNINSDTSDATPMSNEEGTNSAQTTVPTEDPVMREGTDSAGKPTIVESTAEPTVSLTPISSAEAEIKKEAKETKEIPIETPQNIPSSEPMTLYPLSLIPGENGYTTKSVELVSKVFRIQDMYEQIIKATGMFDPQDFVEKYIKVKVDGVEVSNKNFNITADIFFGNDLNNKTGVVRFGVPEGLTPGYHTVQVFAVDNWYLAPSIMVALPAPDEAVLDLQLNSVMPPVAVGLPNDGGYKITLSGKNLIKPFNVVLTDTQGVKYPVDDSYIVVEGTESVTITLPQSFQTGIYSITISKGSQTVYRPNYIVVSKLPMPTSDIPTLIPPTTTK